MTPAACATVVAALSLLGPVEDDSGAPAENGLEAAPEASAAAVSDTMLVGVEGKRVTVTTADGEHTGTLTAIGATSIVLAGDAGQLVEFSKSELREIRLAPADEPATPTTVPAPVPAATMPMCMGDDACDGLRRCIDGQCRVDPADVDELEAEGHARRKGGLITMSIGAGLTLVGAILMPVGFVGGNRADEQPVEDFDSLTEQDKRVDRLFGTGYAGAACFGVGVHLLVGGGIAFAVGKGKLRRAKTYRSSLEVSGSPSADGFRLGIRGRF